MSSGGGMAQAVPEGVERGFQKAVAAQPEAAEFRDQLWRLTLDGITRYPPPAGVNPDQVADAIAYSVGVIATAISDDRDEFVRNIVSGGVDVGWICERWPNLWPFCRPLPAPSSELGT